MTLIWFIFIGKHNLKNQNDSLSIYCLRMSCALRAQKMLRNHFYHLTAFIFKELSFVFSKKMMQILISFHAPNYITLKEKTFSTKCFFFNQNDLLIAICFVFLRTYEIYDNQTNAIPIR